MSTIAKANEEFEKFVEERSNAPDATENELQLLHGLLINIRRGRIRVALNPEWDGVADDRFVYSALPMMEGIV